jgi:hypothetical protein
MLLRRTAITYSIVLEIIVMDFHSYQTILSLFPLQCSKFLCDNSKIMIEGIFIRYTVYINYYFDRIKCSIMFFINLHQIKWFAFYCFLIAISFFTIQFLQIWYIFYQINFRQIINNIRLPPAA